MHFDGWTLLLQAINFLVLVWLLRHFLYRPVLAVIAARQAATEKIRSDAEATRRDADQIRQGLEGQRAGLAEERDRLLAIARTQAEAERAALLDRARGEADRLLAEGRAALDEERRQALDAQREHTASLGVAVAARLLRAVSDGGSGRGEGQGEEEGAAEESADRRFLDDACRTVAALPEPQRRALAEDDSEGGDPDQAGGPLPVRLVSAAPLAPADAERCRERLAAALGRPLALTLDQDPGLIAGVELHFPHSVLRRSWKQALAEATEELTRDDHPQRGA